MPKVSELTATPAFTPGDLVYVVTDGMSAKLAGLKVATIADMQSILAPVSGMVVEVTAAEVGGTFVFSSTAASDGGTAFAATDLTAGAWVRQYSGPVDVYWFDVNPTDGSAALQAALDTGEPVAVPHGVILVDNVTGSNINLGGAGTIRKKPNTKGKMLELSGENRIDGLTFDYDWQNRTDAAPYWPDVCVWQDGGSLTATNCVFTRTLAQGVRTQAGSLFVSGCKFSAGATHNNLGGGNERVTEYISARATAEIADTARISICNNDFIGSVFTPADYYLNPGGIFINAVSPDGLRYESAMIHGNTFEAVGQSAGANGNRIGVIDTYNGVKNVSIVGNVMRKYSYAGIKCQNSDNVSIVGNVIEEGLNGASSTDPGQSYGILVTEKNRGATGEKENAVICGNVVDDCGYTGILSNIDNAVISGNVVRGVAIATVGTGIWNFGGNRVQIVNNVVQDHDGIGINSSGNDVLISGNTTRNTSGTNGISIFFSGSRCAVTGNNCANPTASPTNPGIRTNGPVTGAVITGNTLSGLATGIDLRITDGAVSGVELGPNVFSSVTTPENIVAGVTGNRVTTAAL
jgi:putative cofactor-binding repeat protein